MHSPFILSCFNSLVSWVICPFMHSTINPIFSFTYNLAFGPVAGAGLSGLAPAVTLDIKMLDYMLCSYSTGGDQP